MTSKDLVTIDGTMTPADVIGYFGNPDGFTFNFAEDPEAVSARIEARLLSATSLDELVGGGDDVLKARDNLGKPFQFISVEWRPSDMEGDGLPFYALFKLSDAQGNIHLMSCGARNVVLKAAKIAQEGWFPCWLRIVEVQVKNPVKGRSAPLDLVSAPEPTFDSEGKEF